MIKEDAYRNMNKIEIGLPYEVILERKNRVETAARLRKTDRVPFIPGFSTRYLIRKLDRSFQRYFSEPGYMLETQLMGIKWIFENIKCDMYEPTGAWTAVWVDFQNVMDPSAFNNRVVFYDNDIPCAYNTGWVKTEEDLEKLKEIDFINNGLHTKAQEFFHEMKNIAENYDVRFTGGPWMNMGDMVRISEGSNGIFENAGQLMGTETLCYAMYDDPEFVYKLFDIITEKIFQWTDFASKLNGTGLTDFGTSEDPSIILSAELFEKFLLPFLVRQQNRYTGKMSLHMCGKIDHFAEIFGNKLNLSTLCGFSYQNDRLILGRNLGGKAVLLGGVSPVNIAYGTEKSIMEEVKSVIEAFKDYNGFILADGFNIPPGASVENINAVYEAVCKYGRIS